MKDSFGTFMCGFLMGFAAFAILLAVTSNTYYDGQVDAHNGRWKIELRDNPDGTRTWERKTQ